MSTTISLSGGLSNHARGRRLADELNAQTVPSSKPDSGLCLYFGNEFQKLPKKAQSDWLDWSQEPGRVFLLVPPFHSGSLAAMLDWEVLTVGNVPDSLASALAKWLSSEVRHQFNGTLQVPAKPNGAWDNGVVNTCFYRRHPHSGLFAATSLPVWSLALLDAGHLLKQWLDELLDLAGSAAEPEEDQASTLTLSAGHFTMLLHLCEGPFSDGEAALAAVMKSDHFHIPITQARTYLVDLEAQGLVRDGGLTEEGRALLNQSPYAPYVFELEKRTR